MSKPRGRHDAAELPFIEAEIPYIDTRESSITLSYENARALSDLRIARPKVRVRNARPVNDDLSLDREGFLLARCPSDAASNEDMLRENAAPRDDVPRINNAYAEELAPLMLRISGAREVVPQFGTTQVRFSNRAAYRSWLATAAFAHMDFTAAQAEQLVETTLKLSGRRVAPYRKHTMIQTWRVLTPPPQDMPLALCDGRTVTSDGAVGMDFIGPKGSRNELIKSRLSVFKPEHEWYYFPNMRPEEVLVFKGYDSSAPEARTAMHTAFDDTGVVNAVPRGSVECRFIAFYD